MFQKKSRVLTVQDTIYRNIFAELIRTKLPLFRSVAVKIVNSPADADDVVQNALLRAWDKRHSFSGKQEALSAWVVKIVVSESYNLLRKKQCEENKLKLFEYPVSEENSALSALDEAINSLPELYKETVHIAILSNLSIEEASGVLGCSANTLYQRIHKAKGMIRNIIRSNADE